MSIAHQIGPLNDVACDEGRWGRYTPAFESFQSFATELHNVFGMRARGPRGGTGAKEPLPGWNGAGFCH